MLVSVDFQEEGKLLLQINPSKLEQLQEELNTFNELYDEEKITCDFVTYLRQMEFEFIKPEIEEI